MSDSDRKQATRDESERSSKRSAGRRRSKSQNESKTEPSGKAEETKPAAESDAKPAAGLDESGKMSSLLENTGEDVRRLLKAADDASKKIREAAQTEAGPKAGGESSGGGAKSGEDTGSLVNRINREVQQVLETADDAADKIREEARGEARQVVEEAKRRAESVTKRQMDRVSDMTSQVSAELAAVQEKLVRLQAAYDQAMQTMGADLQLEQSTRVWETQKNRNGEVEVDEEQGEALRRRLGKRSSRKGAAEPEGISEGARLLALQQMMAGVDPKVIETRLRNEFNIDDPKPILDWMGLHAPAARAQTKKSKKP